MGNKSFIITKIFSVDCAVDNDGYAILDAQVGLEDGRVVMIEEVSEIAVGMMVKISRIKVFCTSSQDDIWEIVND